MSSVAYNVGVKMADVLGVFEGVFEQVVLLSVFGLGKNAYGRTVCRDVQMRLQRDVAAGAVYATLDRPEGKVFDLVPAQCGNFGPRRPIPTLLHT